jgi:hypothetical protein
MDEVCSGSRSSVNSGPVQRQVLDRSELTKRCSSRCARISRVTGMVIITLVVEEGDGDGAVVDKKVM